MPLHNEKARQAVNSLSVIVPDAQEELSRGCIRRPSTTTDCCAMERQGFG
jgi:hypothetical protein